MNGLHLDLSADIMNTNTVTQTLMNAWQLSRAYGLYWVSITLGSIIFCFHICPSDLVLKEKKARSIAQKNEILGLIKKIDQTRAKMTFAQNQNPFFMERLIREQFNLKRNETPNTSTSIHPTL